MRGQVWYIPFPTYGEKPALIVSNNRRNVRLDSVIAFRITSAPKPALETIVPLDHQDPLVGSVLCDDPVVIHKRALKRRAGALSRSTMSRVDAAIVAAFGIAVS